MGERHHYHKLYDSIKTTYSNVQFAACSVSNAEFEFWNVPLMENIKQISKYIFSKQGKWDSVLSEHVTTGQPATASMKNNLPLPYDHLCQLLPVQAPFPPVSVCICKIYSGCSRCQVICLADDTAHSLW